MEELIRKISEAAGISDEQARLAAAAALAYFHEKLPASLAVHLDNAAVAERDDDETSQMIVSHMFAGSKE